MTAVAIGKLFIDPEDGKKYDIYLDDEGAIQFIYRQLNPRADHEFIYVQRHRRAAHRFPHIRQRLYDVRTSAGCDVTLEVRVHGYPDDCTATWTLNDRPLARREVDNVDMRRAGPGLFQLFIHRAEPANGGLYACTVRNRAGTSRTTAFVRVEPVGAGRYVPERVPKPLTYSNHTWT